MNNIKAIKTVRKVDPDVVDILEKALALAKTGEITSAALVVTHVDTNVAIHWTSGNALTPFPSLIGGCTLCIKQLTERWAGE